jgi:hypothetical protein
MADSKIIKSSRLPQGNLNWEMLGPFGDGLMTFHAYDLPDEYFIHSRYQEKQYPVILRACIGGIETEVKKKNLHKAFEAAARLQKAYGVRK